MAYIAVFPKSIKVQQNLTEDFTAMMNILHKTTKDVLNVPDYDIIVELNACSAIAFNPLAVQANSVPDVVIKIATSDLDLQSEFQTLCERIVDTWDIHFEKTLKLELWVNTISAWGCNMEFS